MSKNFLGAIIVFISSLVCAQDSFIPNSSNITGGLLGEMENIAKMAPKDGALFKAMVYEYGYPEEGIKPNPEKSIELYKEAFAKKNPIAAFKLGMKAWAEEHVSQSFNGAPLEYFLSAKHFEPRQQADLNLIAGGIYLYTIGAFNEAIVVLEGPSKRHHSTAQLYLAFAFLEKGNIAQANANLTLACSNISKAKDVEEFCSKQEFVEKVDLREAHKENSGVHNVQDYSNSIVSCLAN